MGVHPAGSTDFLVYRTSIAPQSAHKIGPWALSGGGEAKPPGE